MTEDMEQVTALRRKLLANGFTPIRNYDKRTFMTGWPDAHVDDAEIERWGRMTRDKATGIRVEGGLAVIDIDIDDKDAVDEIADAILDATPELGNADKPLLVRRGKGAKEAWFVRTAEDFGRIHSRAWVRPGEGVDAGAHRIECFGGASPRQFGSFGPHTVAADASAAVWYSWDDASPADTRQSELPELTKAQFFAIMDIVERVLERRGWAVVMQSEKGEDHAQRVYDLDDAMSFDVDTGETLSLQQLRERAAAAGEHGLRCSAAWLEGPSAKRTDRCLVSLTRAGYVAIHETASGVTHIEAIAEPKTPQLDFDRLAEKLQELKERRRTKISSEDDAHTAAVKLLQSTAFCPNQPQQCIVPVWTNDVGAGINPTMFRLKLLPNCDEEIGPRGGVRKINPADLWMASPQRLTVAGVRLRPDQPRPTYEEAGQLWVNAYDPPLHADGDKGTAVPGIRFIEHLLPVAEERRWFLQWLSFKLRSPHIPGPAVVMVAKQFGTGRGTLGELVKRLVGDRYFRTIPFSTFTGKTSQSQYNEWMVGSLVVMVNESSESEGSTFQTKHNTYEHLKELVDPRPIEREIYVKSRPNYAAVSSTSYIIATNNEDALPIPADDRRFAVLSNGELAGQDFWDEINGWMAQPVNVAAFNDWLLTAVDLTGYSPFALPPRTEIKAAMVEAGRSDLDRAIDAALSALNTDLFLIEQLTPMVMRIADRDGLLLPDVGPNKLRATIQKIAERVTFRVGGNVEEGSGSRRVRIDNRQFRVRARTYKAAGQAAVMDAHELRRAVLRNGTPEGVKGNVETLLKRG